MSDLHHFCAGTKEGWSTFVYADGPQLPDRLTVKKLEALSSSDKVAYDHQRERWHANMGTLQTPQVEKMMRELRVVLRSNVQHGDRAKGAVAVEGDTFLGKTTIVQHFAKEYHLREIALNGDMTDAGDERWPVVYVTLTGHPTMRDLNSSLLHYFAHPGSGLGSAAELARRALDAFLKCGVSLLIIDDLHFLRWESVDGSKVSNHLKYLVNDFPITMILVGTELTQRGLYRADHGFGGAVLGPTARRTTSLSLKPYTIDSAAELKQWRSIIHAIERNLVLARHRDGTLTHQLAEYLFDRSTGYMGSLVTLINRAATRAIITGVEAITEEVLDDTVIDFAAEQQREAVAVRRLNKRRAKTTRRERAPAALTRSRRATRGSQ
jgi:hypothetical protein